MNQQGSYQLSVIASHSLHQLMINEAVIAASRKALIVREQGLRNILYIPREDVLVPLSRMKGQSSYCPFKGAASYWTLEANGQSYDKIGWSYDFPYDEVAPIKGHIAFYLDKLDCYWCNGIEQELYGPGPCHDDDCHASIAA